MTGGDPVPAPDGPVPSNVEGPVPSHVEGPVPSHVEGPIRLPDFIPPMLCKPAPGPFDSDAHLFEVKWDGTRVIVLRDLGGVRLLNRRKIDITYRFPELRDALAMLPEGTALDGEVVVFSGGRPDFAKLQKRDHAMSPQRIGRSARTMPATFVAFDLMFVAGRCVMDEPCAQRRERLREVIRQLDERWVVMSEGVVGPGVAYYEQVVARGLEGVIAKRLDSKYHPGLRSETWLKIKRQELVQCVVLGWVPKEDDRSDFRSLVLGAQEGEGGALRYVGRVGGGINADQRLIINRWLKTRRCEKPVAPVPHKAVWVIPELYLLVRCMERTPGGHLRSPVLEKIIKGV